MDSNDRNLGMNSRITRRDFLNGVALTVGASLVPSPLEELLAQGIGQDDPRYYPPLLTGMRGSHAGSFEVAHQMRDDRKWDLSRAENTGENYDLVIVGGGLSGLAAAHYFIKDVGRNARVLVLDNHDDFGGHAKRNEFSYNGRMLALNGGTLNIESPLHYNLPARQLLQDVGIDLDRFETANAKNRDLYRSLGLNGSALFFDKETWGVDKLAVRAGAAGGRGSAGGRGAGQGPGQGGRGGGRGGTYTAEFLAETPLSPKA